MNNNKAIEIVKVIQSQYEELGKYCRKKSQPCGIEDERAEALQILISTAKAVDEAGEEFNCELIPHDRFDCIALPIVAKLKVEVEGQRKINGRHTQATLKLQAENEELKKQIPTGLLAGSSDTDIFISKLQSKIKELEEKLNKQTHSAQFRRVEMQLKIIADLEKDVAANQNIILKLEQEKKGVEKKLGGVKHKAIALVSKLQRGEYIDWIIEIKKLTT